MEDGITFPPHAVAVPEMGTASYIRFNMAAIEAMCDTYDHWMQEVEVGLAASNTAMLRQVLSVTLFGAEVEETVNAVAFHVLADRIMEAIGLTWYGPKKWSAMKDMRHATNLRPFFEGHWIYGVMDAFVEGWPLALKTALGAAMGRAKAEPAIASAEFASLAQRILEHIGEHAFKDQWKKQKKEAGYV